MKKQNRKTSSALLGRGLNEKHIHISVNGCTVTLNLPAQSDCSVISDVKRMMIQHVSGS